MDANLKSRSGIPPEVVAFLSGKGGRSLIVKGGAGTGKTTFGLELLEKVGRTGQSFYLSTRVSDEALYRQFPWLRSSEMRTRVFDAGKIFLETLVGKDKEPAGPEPAPAVKEKLNSARDFLKSIGEDRGPPTKVDRAQLASLLQHTRMPEVEHMYDRVERVLPEKALLVVDSLEGVTHKYGLEMEEFVMCLQKDLVENSNTNVVMILEKPEAGGIEYLVDGLLSFSREELDERRVRHMRLDKLRATAIPRPRYAVTLAGGRFEALGVAPRSELMPGPQPWRAVPDSEKTYSTGTPDFDALLGGGFRKGSYNGFEIDVNVSIDDYYLLFVPPFLNFLAQGRGILGILAGGESPEKLRELLTTYVPPSTFDNRVRITDYFATETQSSYIIPMGRAGREDGMRALQAAERAVRGGAEQKPFIEYTAFDTLEYLQGDQLAIKNLFIGVERTKILGNLGIGLLKPGLLVTSEIINMMDTYFRIINIDNSPCIYGIRPRTMVYSIAVDFEKGPPYARLTPIV